MQEKRGIKGVTLIALVVTIVVLLILAGVTISMLRGENGIIKQAQKANDTTIDKGAEEKVGLAISAARVKGMGVLTVSNLKEEVENNYGGTVTGTEFPVTMTIDGKEISVKEDGSIANSKQFPTDVKIGDSIKLTSNLDTPEEFYVLSYDEGTGLAKALAMYNLKVGNIYNDNNTLTEMDSSIEGYGLQDSEMKGMVNLGKPYKGTVEFSSEEYWNDTNKYPKGTSEYPYIYNKNDEKCTISQYVEMYKAKLGNIDKVKEVKLASYEDINNLWPQRSMFNWLYSSSYWLGSESSLFIDGPCVVRELEQFTNDYCNNKSSYGVRPVITIDMSKIQ